MSEALSRSGQLDTAGSKHYVSELAAKVPAAGNARHYAEIVQQNAVRRRLLAAGQEIQAAATEPGEGGSEALLRRADELLSAVTPEREPTASRDPAAVLAAAAVDLVDVIERGLPDRAFVPGGEPWLLAGKRYLLPAPAGTGKSLLAIIVAVAVVAAGGTVAILDVENGADEYARRLADVLNAREDGDAIAAACSERLRYFEWPALRVTWGPEEWAAALAGADLAVFDSSRLMLSAAGLAEDSNDDYSTFVSALLVPLARAGIATVVLDNTGHDGDRARGASAKGDLNEVVYVVETGEPFDREQLGHLRLVRRRTRFAELPGELHVPIGGGVYGPVEEAEPAPDSDAFRPTTLMERISEAIELEPGLSSTKVLDAVEGKTDWKRKALKLLIAEGYVCVEREGKQTRKHYCARLYRAAEDPAVEAPDG